MPGALTQISRSLVAVVVCACSSASRQPPGAPPSRESISMANPGGDAHDPHEAALRRQLEAPWGKRRDKDNQLIVPMPDHGRYKRVRYWAIDHFVGFRYGSDYHVMNTVFVQDVPEGVAVDTRTCMRRAEAWGRPQLRSFGVKLGPMYSRVKKWRNKEVLVKWVDGYLDFGMRRRRFSAAWAAYPAYQEACLIFAVAVPWREQEALAKQVRDRWVEEGTERLLPLTSRRPYRK